MPSIALILGMIISYHYHTQIHNLERNSLLNFQQKLLPLQSKLEQEISAGEYELAAHTLSELGSEKGILALAVIDINNHLLVAQNSQWDRQPAAQVIPGFNADRFSQAISRQQVITQKTVDGLRLQAYFPLNPLPLGNNGRAALYYLFDLNPGYVAIVNKIIEESIIAGLLWLFLTGLFVTALHFLISKPVKLLSKAAINISEDHDSNQLIIKGQGEMAELGFAFNTMSAQKAARFKTLQNSEKHFRSLVETTSDWVWEVNSNAEYTYASPQCRDLLGYAPEELLGKTPFTLMAPDEAQRVGKEFALIRQQQQPFHGLENTNLHKNGHPVILETSGYPFFDQQGALLGYRGIDRDISKRRKEEQALAVTELRYQTLIDYAPEAIVILNQETMLFEEINNNALTLFGLSREEMYQRGPVDISPILQSDGTNSIEAAQEVFKELEKHDQLTFEWLHQNSAGKIIPCEIRLVKLPSSGKKLLRASVIDISERKLAEAREASLGAIIENSLNEIYVFDVETLHFIEVNKGARENLDYSESEIRLLTPLDLKPEFTLESFTKLVKPLKDGEKKIIVFETRHKRKNGTFYDVEVHLQRFIFGMQPVFVAIILDITERKQTERALTASENKFRELFELMPNTAVQGYDHQGKVIFWNKASEQLYGFSKQEAIGQKIEDLIIPEAMVEHVKHAINDFIHKDIQIPAAEHDLRHKDGSAVPVFSSHIKLQNALGEPEMYCIDFDLKENRKAQAEIAQLAYFDVLTNLPNRRLFLDRLDQEIAVAVRHSNYGAVLFLDLDNFKTVNDALSHAIGDALLQQVAKRMQDQLRAEDTVARLGGDEFVILLKELGEDSTIAANQAQMVAEKIQQTISKPFSIEDHELFITPSIGISLFAKENNNAAKIMNQADTAMYRAKDAGRNTLRFYRASMQVAADARLAMEKDLRKALHGNQLFLHYQPQTDLNNIIIGAEALLRWQHPTRGRISPMEFIPLAEETGMIQQIGEQVLLNACKQLKKWENLYQTLPFHLAVNVSAHQFRMADFVLNIQEVIEKTDINPYHLMLEVTESVLIENISETVNKMHALKELGVSFSIDDFGTGYSSLAYLKSLPLDQLKIDQSFVRDIHRDANDEAIVETIITMTQILGIDVLAEGVETEEQFQFLQKKGCRAFQGYYFGKPVPADKFSFKQKKDPFSKLFTSFRKH